MDEDDTDRKVSFLNFPSGSDFVLLNVWNDKTFLNDYFGYTLHEEMGHYSVRRRFVEVFFNGNYPGNAVAGPVPTPDKVGTNDYAGIYLLLEKIRISPNRVNLAQLTPEDTAEPAIVTGAVPTAACTEPVPLNVAPPEAVSVIPDGVRLPPLSLTT